MLNSKQLLKSSSFLECDRQVISYILKMDALSCSELELFDACMSWLKVISKQETITRDIIQKHLGESFYDIGFGIMAIDEFISILPLYLDIFSSNELHEIFQQILEKNTNTIHFKQHRLAHAFRTKLDKFDERKLITFARYLAKVDMFRENVMRERTTFCSDASLLFRGFSIIGFDYETTGAYKP